MDIKQIDKNFDTTFIAPQDVEWFSVREFPFSVHGVFYSEDEGLYRRLPKEIAEATNEGVAHLSKHTAGGRVRFITDSPYIIVRIEEPFEEPFSHMTIAGKYGISLFVNNVFTGTIMPTYEQIASGNPTGGGNGKIVFDGIKYPYGMNGKAYQTEIFFPLYSAVNAMYVGLKKGSVIRSPKAYKHKTPVLFYGSSITQGACASKPGDDYINRLCRMLDTDIINLGFSGSARAEMVMAEYLSSLNSSVFVMDYDHNAPSVEDLEKTHYALYQTFRKARPNTPIIMMSMPTIEGYETRPWYMGRKDVIINSFNYAVAEGDKNVYFIDCYGCFGNLENCEYGTVDDCHPDSLGFMRMTERVYPVLERVLNEKK